MEVRISESKMQELLKLKSLIINILCNFRLAFLQKWSCSGKLPLFQADPSEVIVPAPDLSMVGFDGFPVVLALGFLVLAIHAKDVLVIHAHDPAAIQRLSASVAVFNFKKSVSHISSFKRFYPDTAGCSVLLYCHVLF